LAGRFLNLGWAMGMSSGFFKEETAKTKYKNIVSGWWHIFTSVII
jgi:hypothetical protein